MISLDNESIAILGTIITGLAGIVGLLIRWMMSTITSQMDRANTVIDNNTSALATITAIMEKCKGKK